MSGRPIIRRIGAPVRRALLAAAFARADGVIASFPKSGRTWLRFILANYLNRVLDLGLVVDFRTMFRLVPNDRFDLERGWPARAFGGRTGTPLLVMSHAPFRPSLVFRKPVLFMCRDPKDTLVSYYFHCTRHNGACAGWTIKRFLRDPERGVEAFCRYYGGWAAGLADHPHMVLAYERLKREPEAAVAAVLRFFRLPYDDAALAHALEASTLDAMRSVERQTIIPGHRYDVNDVDGRRVRQGRIGGYMQHLDPDDIAHVERTCRDRLGAAAGAWLGWEGADRAERRCA